MKGSDSSLCIALCVSLLVHGTGVYTVSEHYIRTLTWELFHPSRVRWNAASVSGRGAVVPDSAPPLSLVEQSIEGELGGQGTAFNSSPGDQPMRAPQADSEQAYISHNAAARSAGVSDAAPGQGGQNAPRLVPQEASVAAMTALLAEATRQPAPLGLPPAPPPPPPTLLRGQKIPPSQFSAAALASQLPSAPATQASAATHPSAAPVGLPSQSVAAAAAPSHGGAPGQSGPAPRGGDGGNPGQAEADPFSSQNADVSYANGRVTARNGRVKKSYRVYLNNAAYFAVISMKDPTVVLKAKLDAQGKVVDITVVKSSGSDDVDLPARLSLQKWEFEPAHDADGKSIGDEIVIRFTWR